MNIGMEKAASETFKNVASPWTRLEWNSFI